MTPDWSAARERLLRGPAHAPLHAALSRLPEDHWPDDAELTAAAEGITTSKGKALRFVKPAPQGERRSYEARIAQAGEVATRPRHGHDLCNALAWMTFPKTKAAINAQHVAILAEGGEAEARKRGPERDALTLFDESGLIVASASVALLKLVQAGAWKELFWTRRAEVEAQMRFFLFGHSLHEQLLDPFPGLTAKALFVPVGDFFFMLSPQGQVEEVDAMAARHFSSRVRFHSPKAMCAVPILGIPGWASANASAEYYDDEDQFRGREGAGSEE